MGAVQTTDLELTPLLTEESTPLQAVEKKSHALGRIWTSSKEWAARHKKEIGIAMLILGAVAMLASPEVAVTASFAATLVVAGIGMLIYLIGSAVYISGIT